MVVGEEILIPQWLRPDKFAFAHVNNPIPTLSQATLNAVGKKRRAKAGK